MAADEYYDAIGEVLAYVLSAEDKIVTQNRHDSGKYFIIERDSTHLEFFAKPNDRYFTLIYQFSLTQRITNAYKNERQLLRGDLEQFNIDDSEYRDENLDEIVAMERVKSVDREEANDLVVDLRGLAAHTDCRFDNITREVYYDDQTDQEVWDGIMVAGLLYPYEENFSPRDYEQVAQEVISVGEQIEETMGKLDVLEQVGL